MASYNVFGEDQSDSCSLDEESKDGEKYDGANKSYLNFGLVDYESQSARALVLKTDKQQANDYDPTMILQNIIYKLEDASPGVSPGSVLSRMSNRQKKKTLFNLQQKIQESKMIQKLDTVMFKSKKTWNQKERREQLQITLTDMTRDMNEQKRSGILGPKIMELMGKINREQLDEFDSRLEKKSAMQIMNYAHKGATHNNPLNVQNELEAFLKEKQLLYQEFQDIPQQDERWKLDLDFESKQNIANKKTKDQRCCGKKTKQENDDETDSSAEDDINNPIMWFKIEKISKRVEQRYEKNQAALENWVKLRNVLRCYLLNFHEAGKIREVDTLNYMVSSTLRAHSSRNLNQVLKRFKREKVTAQCIISPLGRFFVWWTLVQQFVFVGWHFLFWTRVAFGPLDESLARLRPIELLLDSLFFLDVVFKFFTGIPFTDTEKYQAMRGGSDDREYGYVFSHRRIALYYIKTTFFVDLVSLIPYFLYWPITQYGEEEPLWVYVYYLKVVRLLFSRSINHTIDTIFTQIGVYEQLLSMRTKNYIMMLAVFVKLVLNVHCLTCMWIFIGRRDEKSIFSTVNYIAGDMSEQGGWITRNEMKYGQLANQEIYVYALSLITETISKVGYGMEHAPLSALEMVFLIIIIMINSNLLAIIFYQISQLQHKQPLKMFLQTHLKEMESYLSQIEKLSGDQMNNKKTFDLVMRHAAKEFQESTELTFNSIFYKQLPPGLRRKLVFTCLPKIIKQLKYFFRDFQQVAGGMTNKDFVCKLVTSLHVKNFEDYETIIEAGQNFDAVYFIDESWVNIIDCTGLFVIAVLKKGSFFGEFQVLHNMASGFEYRLDKERPEKEDIPSKQQGNWLYSIHADRYNQICADFPEYLDFMRLRSSLRRAHLFRIQKELYDSFIFNSRNDENFVDSSSFDLSYYDEDGNYEKQDERLSFLPAQLRNFMKIDFRKSIYFQKGEYNTMTEQFVMRLPRGMTQAQCFRLLSRTNSQTSRFFHKSDYLCTKLYIQTIAQQKYMKLSILEDSESLKQETYSRLIRACFSQAVPRVLLRQAITLALLDNTRLKHEFGDLVQRMEENKVLNFYTNHLQYSQNIDVKELLQEILISEKYQDRMRRYRQQKIQQEQGFSKKKLKALKSTYYNKKDTDALFQLAPVTMLQEIVNNSQQKQASSHLADILGKTQFRVMLSRAKTEELPSMFNMAKLGIAKQKKSDALTNYHVAGNQPVKVGLKKISEDTSKDEEDDGSSFDNKFLTNNQADNPDSNKRRKSFKTVYQANKSSLEDSAYDSKNLDDIEREDTSPLKRDQIRVQKLGSKAGENMLLESYEVEESKVSLSLLEDHHNLVDVKESDQKEPKVHPVSFPEQTEIPKEPDTWSNIQQKRAPIIKITKTNSSPTQNQQHVHINEASMNFTNVAKPNELKDSDEVVVTAQEYLGTYQHNQAVTFQDEPANRVTKQNLKVMLEPRVDQSVNASAYTKQSRPSNTGHGSRKRFDDTLESDKDTMQRRSLGNIGNAAAGKPYDSIVPEGVRDSIVTARQIDLVDAEQPQNSERQGLLKGESTSMNGERISSLYEPQSRLRISPNGTATLPSRTENTTQAQTMANRAKVMSPSKRPAEKQNRTNSNTSGGNKLVTSQAPKNKFLRINNALTKPKKE